LIVVAGEALLDLVPAADGQEQARPGGGPFNTARALARLGLATAFLGHLSEDSDGQRLADLLAGDGVDLSLASFGPETTTLALADLDGDGHAAYRFLVEGTSAPQLARSAMPIDLPADVRALHVGTLGLVLEPMATSITELVLHEAGRRVVMLDPNIRPAMLGDEGGYRHRLESILCASTIIKASDADLAWLYPDLAVEAAIARLAQGSAGLVVVTSGAGGALGWCDGRLVSVLAPRVEVVDTIGAGDAFGAGLLAWLDEHRLLHPGFKLGRPELASALEFACLVASLTCTRPGAEPPWRAEVDSWRQDSATND
jgi:fructokinase